MADADVEARVRKFERLGGVDLARLEPEERLVARRDAALGLASFKQAVFHWRCEVCGNTAVSDQLLSPACTGPFWTDDHPLEPMVLDG